MKRREELDKYHDLSAEELQAETSRLKESLFRLKFKLALGEVDAVKAIFTNAPGDYARRVLAALGIERHFEHMFDIRFHTFRPKPDPAAYERVLATLGVVGAEVAFLEDTACNLLPARALGMTTILVGDMPRQGEVAADHVAPDILAALRFVLELQA